MQWVAISGSWRAARPEVEKKVREVVRDIMLRGDGIVSGGALGVDAIALDEALKANPTADRVRIFIPTPLLTYAAHYRKRATEGVITAEQAEILVAQLEDLQRRCAQGLVEDPTQDVCNPTTYFKRNGDVINASNALVAFHVLADDTKGEGTLDTVTKARAKGMPVEVYQFDFRTQK